MSIQSEIERIHQNIADTYAILEEAGATMPASQNSNNLAATATNIKAVLYNKKQELTKSQKDQARSNLGITGAASVLDYYIEEDGTANSTTVAFQKALANNRTVFVPGGTYVLSDTLVIRENCCLELSQDTVLRFADNVGDIDCIELRGSATLRGNHAIIAVPYSFSGHVIDIDTLDENDFANEGLHATAIPPYSKSSPMFKRQRFVYDINIVKFIDDYGRIGFCSSKYGECSGTGVYISATNVPKSDTNPLNNDVSWIWASTLSGIRIAGAFNYGIHAINFDSSAPEGYEDDGWNHDMRIEAVIEACEIGVALENCNGARLAVTIQPSLPVYEVNGAKVKYAKHGVYLNDSKFVDMTSSRVWDWDANRTLWTSGGQYQHLAMIGNCRGLLLDDFLSHESSADIRTLIYTDTPANFNTMTVLQEPSDRYFKSEGNIPYFFDGTNYKQLRLYSDKITAENTYFIESSNGKYEYMPKFTNLVPSSIDSDGAVYNGKGYMNGAGLTNAGNVTTDISSNTVSGFIDLGSSPYHTYRVAGSNISFDTYGCNLCFYDANFALLKVIPHNHINDGPASDGVYYWGKVTEEENTLLTYTAAKDISTGIYVSGIENAAYVRISVKGRCSDLTFTIDEPLDYDAIWLGEPMRLDESIYAQNLFLKAPNGLGYKIAVTNDGVLTAELFQ